MVEPTAAERKALENLAAGRASSDGLTKRGELNNHCKVRAALRRKGWLGQGKDGAITDAGRAAIVAPPDGARGSGT